MVLVGSRIFQWVIYSRWGNCRIEGKKSWQKSIKFPSFLSRRERSAPGATWVLVLAASEECFPIFAIETGYSLTRILSQTTVTGCLGEQARSNLHARLCQERLPSFLLFPPRVRFIPFFPVALVWNFAFGRPAGFAPCFAGIHSI